MFGIGIKGGRVWDQLWVCLGFSVCALGGVVLVVLSFFLDFLWPRHPLDAVDRKLKAIPMQSG